MGGRQSPGQGKRIQTGGVNRFLGASKRHQLNRQIIDTSVLQKYSRAARRKSTLVVLPLSVAPADIRSAAHPARASGKLGTLRLCARLRGERVKRGGQMRLPATWARNRVAIPPHQLLRLD